MDRTGRRRLPGSYWRLWTASGISNLGDGVLLAALPLLAARSTDSALSVSLISTFFTIPWLLFALPAGALIDRIDRRRILVSADLFRGVLVAGLAAIAAVTDVQIWMLWVLAFGLGVGEVFFDSTSQAILPAIVPADRLEQANGWRYSVEMATNTFLGLPVGSVLFAAAVWLPFGVDAVSFVVAAVLAASLRGSFKPATAATPQSMRADVGEGFRWLWGHQLLRNLAIGLALTNLAFAACESTFVLFATRELGVSERFFGPLVAIVGGGSILAGMLGSKLVDKVGRRFAILVAAFAPAVTMTAIGTVAITWWVVAMTTVQAVMITIWSIIAVSLRQQIVPDHLFGRVNSVYRWFSWGAMPIGGVLGGVVAQNFGLRAPYFFGAAVILIAYVLIATHVTESAIAKAISANRSPLPDSPDQLPTADDETPISLDRDPFDELL